LSSIPSKARMDGSLEVLRLGLEKKLNMLRVQAMEIASYHRLFSKSARGVGPVPGPGA
jgi:hypothetical protein